MRSTVFLIGVAGLGRASPKLGSAPVVGDNNRVRVADVDGRRQDFDKCARKPVVLSWGWNRFLQKTRRDDAACSVFVAACPTLGGRDHAAREVSTVSEAESCERNFTQT